MIKEDSFSLFKASNSSLVDGSQYNVFALPVESPNHGTRQIVSQPANPNASPFGWHDTDGFPGADLTITRGNNVWVQENVDADPNATGFSADGGTSLNFDFPFNTNLQPLNYQNASLTNLFYANNMMHDIWYEYGFDEASGNFQQNNYFNGGIEGDYVFANGQDGSGLNNATFGTPPDGNNGVMNMFLWSAVGPIGQPLIINNSTVAGTYTANISTFGAPLTDIPITADLALVIDDDSGESTNSADACDPIINGADLNGKIAVLRRGICEFGFKILAAQNEGAVAVIVINNTFGDPIQMVGGAFGGEVTIPSIMISLTDAGVILSALNNGEIINASLIASIGPYQRDGSLDNIIVSHEYGHGISTRLTGGAANSGCLGNAEQMGEGWSDWFGLMLTIRATDLPEAVRGIGTYALTQPTDGVGIRPFPYSTDTNINPLTYGDTNNGSISVPHGIGTVWGTMLWDLTWAYIDKYGFDADLYNGTGGNNRVMQLVTDGLKLQPCGTGFVEGRDALLAADVALTGGEDACLIWEVFAARGLGVGASQGSANSRSDQIESFIMPDVTDPSLANCSSLSIDEFNVSDYKIFPNPSNDIIYIQTAKSFGEVVITLTDINGRQVLSKITVLNNLNEINISNLQSGLYILNIKGDSINTNDKILKN